MFSYYGSKSKIAWRYPAPIFQKIIEPFAGAAWYSLLYKERNVLLNEKDPTIFALWHWLINKADPKDILANKDFYAGQDIRGLTLAKEHLWLIGLSINKGSIAPRNIVQKWVCSVKARPNWASQTAFRLERVALLIPGIKHWGSRYGTYEDLPNEEATWFIDPPYQHGGSYYKENKIDYVNLASWCKTRKGQVIVCENDQADWLPFNPLIQTRGQRKVNMEAVWLNRI